MSTFFPEATFKANVSLAFRRVGSLILASLRSSCWCCHTRRPSGNFFAGVSCEFARSSATANHSASPSQLLSSPAQLGLARPGYQLQQPPQQQHCSNPSSSQHANGSVTHGHLSAFRNSVTALFYERGKEALPMALVRKHVLATTDLNESQTAACLKIMLSQNKMLETADYLCLIWFFPVFCFTLTNGTNKFFTSLHIFLWGNSS